MEKGKSNFKMLRRKNILFLFLSFLIVLGAYGFHESYARYTSSVDVNVGTVSGEMICNIRVETEDFYVENNVAYFLIYVSNAKDGVVTATDVDYNITISNIAGSNGTFYYVDSDGIKSDSNGVFHDSLNSITYSFGKNAEERIFKVYVKVPSNMKEEVNFKVDLDAVQKQMD